MDWSKLFKLSGWHLFAIAVATGIVALGSDRMLERLGVDALRREHAAWVGGAFLLSSALAVTAGTRNLWTKGARQRAARHQREEAYRLMLALPPSEKALLREYVRRRVRSLVFDPSRPAVLSLMHSGVLERPAQITSSLHQMSFVLSEWADACLRDHPDILR